MSKLNVGWLSKWKFLEGGFGQNQAKLAKKSLLLPIYLLPISGIFAANSGVNAQTPPAIRVIVNSNQDGEVTADEKITLREAIELVNGTLKLEQLSPQEQAQVQPLTGTGSRIEFNLPSGETTIQLQKILPDLVATGLTIDGTTQPGYDPNTSATAEIFIPVPVVTITPKPGTEIFRGLTVTADGITIRGLNLYGFNASAIKQQLGNLLIYDGIPKPVTLTTPPGDIVVAHRLPPPDISRQRPPSSNLPFRDRDVPPQNVVIENNWLGLTREQKMPMANSAFGIYVFNSKGTTIRRNRIDFQEGSGIITSVRAENTNISQNILIGNGMAGMPDAVRLEGIVNNSQLTGNLICANDGAGVFLFKPEGRVRLENNKITYNGRRLRRAAVYVMGSNHEIIGNEIDNQTGPGVVVSAFPEHNQGKSNSAIGNIIRNNRFAMLEGLSIDLNTFRNLDVRDFQKGDGPNPRRDSGNRRLDTGNGAVNAPVFTSRRLIPNGGSVTIAGKADPGAEIAIYRLGDYQRGRDAIYDYGYGALSEPLTVITADTDGKFSTTLNNLNRGDVVSAIATDPKYGTSEPAVAAIVGAEGIPNVKPDSRPQPIQPPQCVTPPAPPPPPEPPAPPPPPETIRLRVPNNIHFAFDRSFISDRSAQVLNQIADVLRQYPTIVIEIQGHTDPRGTDAYNLALGRRRALAARNYLLRQGIAPERMTIRSFGERVRRNPGTTGILNYARDRRVEIIFRDIRGVEIIIESQESDLQLEGDPLKR